MLYEVPYNFDEKLIDFYSNYKSFVNYLYIPPYKDDSDNTRTSIQTKSIGHCYMPLSREEYESHIHKIVASGLRFVILWQKPDMPLTDSLIEYYCKLGTSGFIVASDINAESVKLYDKSLLSICSLVQRVCENIRDKDLSNYDYVILYYPFNRALSSLKTLIDIKEKIILMPNTLCNVDCPSLHHWFPKTNDSFVPGRDCLMTEENIGKCGLIFPEHLYLFDDYVGGYKLQGREYPTNAIKHICQYYFKRKKGEDFIDPFLKSSMAEKLKNLAYNTSLEEYYNTKIVEI